MREIIKLFRHFLTGRDSTSGQFSDFFLHASDKKKKSVFTDAAKLANKDQKKVFEESLNYNHR